MEWIKVGERKPIYYKNVLCYWHGIVAVCWRAMHDDGYDIYTIANTNVILDKITHWMPLPEPPKV